MGEEDTCVVQLAGEGEGGHRCGTGVRTYSPLCLSHVRVRRGVYVWACAWGRWRVRVCAGASLCVRTWVHSVPGGTLCARGHVPVVAVWQESVVEGAPRRKRGRARSDEGVHSRAHTHTRRPRERGCILCRVDVACLGYVDDAGGGVVFWARPVLVMTGDGGCLHDGMYGACRRISGEGKLE